MYHLIIVSNKKKCSLRRTSKLFGIELVNTADFSTSLLCLLCNIASLATIAQRGSLFRVRRVQSSRRNILHLIYLLGQYVSARIICTLAAPWRSNWFAAVVVSVKTFYYAGEWYFTRSRNNDVHALKMGADWFVYKIIFRKSFLLLTYAYT